jgi:acyl transferase domain-containing protein/phosphopantetheinyl transferase
MTRRGASAAGAQPPVAIVGMAVLLPGAPDLSTYWQNLVEGVDSITDVPEHRWDPCFYEPDAATGPPRADAIYCRRGGFVDAHAEIDPTEFGIMPGSVSGTEPDQLIALRVAAAAIADAGGEERLAPRERIGVILGRGGYMTPGHVRLEQRVRTARQLVRTLGELIPGIAAEQLDRVKAAFVEQLGPQDPASAIGLVPNLAASRIANRLDLRGPAYTVDAACASALVAVDQAIGELAGGRCDVVLAGGLHHCHDVLLWSVFAQLRALSPSQRIRPFHSEADGLLIGEGTGVVVLKRLADAERDDDRIYAVIRGSGIASDGSATSLVHPSSDGQVLALRRAWQGAGLDPAEAGSLGLLEAHGTATPAGDQAELATVRRVFGESTGEDAVIGSVKSMIGHAMPAAGIAGLVKVALATHRGVLLPTLHCEDPHPALALTRFHAIRSAQPWELPAGQPVRRAAVNAFGFGGINAHVVIEQHAPPSPVGSRGRRAAVVAEPEQVLLLAGASPAAIADLLDREDPAVRALADTAWTTDGCRLGVVDPTPKRLAIARKIVAKGAAWRGRSDVWFSPQPLLLTHPRGHVGFVFPGAEAEFEPRVDDVAARLGLPRPELATGDIRRQSAAVVGVGRLLDRALRDLRVVPDAVAGHSIGEWTAMISAGIYSDDEVDRFLDAFDPDALALPDAVFAALGCGVDRVVDAIAGRPGIVISHDNSPSQSIVCGPAAAVAELVGRFRGQNVLGQVLPFRSGFHTPMLEPYLSPIREAAERFRLHPPAVPIWSATTAALYPADATDVRALFVRHLVERVRFRPLVEAMYAAGVRVFVQVGTGQLPALIDDILRGREHLAVAANTPRRSGLDQLRRVVTALWVEGGSPRAIDAPARPRPTRGRQPVRLDLSAALVSLDGAALPRLGEPAPISAQQPPRLGEPAPIGTQQPGATPALATALSGLDKLAVRSPLMAELTGLLQETADTAVAVVAAAARPDRAVQPQRTVLRVSMQTMPYLRDHALCRQREHWPDDSDRWAIVPATTLIEHMIDAARRIAPGRQPVVVHEAQLSRWVVAAPPQDLTVIAARDGADRVRVTLGEHARAVIELGARYPVDAPRPWSVDVGVESTPEVTAEDLYAKRWMFHGPRFQGVAELTAIGERHIRGLIRTPEAPGALLDNAGQLLGAWMLSTHRTGQVLFPVSVRALRLFGPHPAAGTEIPCTVRIRSVTDAIVEADVQLVHEGRVWAQVDGWQDRRFDGDLRAGRLPESTTLSTFGPGGCAVLFERWRDLASRDLIVRGQLSAPERVDHERCPPRTRRGWLLGRIALKDAVRRSLWDLGFGPIFPAEVRVTNDDSGAPRVAGHNGTILPPLAVSLAHCRDVAVAIARPRATGGGPRVGIDVEEIVERDDTTRDVALSSQETALLVARCAESGEPSATWFTRFWSAKEAVAKAEGTGLEGRPKRFEVVAASSSEMAVRVRRRDGDGDRDRVRYHVHCQQLSSPADLQERQYVVAWTTGPEHEQEEMR